MKNGLSNNFVRAITQDAKGYIWIGTEAGLNCFDGHRFRIYNVNNSGILSNAVSSLLYSKADNTLWIGTRRGLQALNLSTMQFSEIPGINSPDGRTNIVALCADGDRGIWIANRYESLMYLDRKAHTLRTYTRSNFPDLPSSFSSLLDDGNGHLYIGHMWDGMSILDKETSQVARFTHDPADPTSIPDQRVSAIVQDKLGNIWIGTSNGLALFDIASLTFTTFRYDASRPGSLLSNQISHVAEMDDNTLWVSCDIGGINIFDLKSLAFTAPEQLTFRHIGATYTDRGLSSPNICTFFQDSFGNVWIGHSSTGIDFISHTDTPFRLIEYAFDRPAQTPVNKPAKSVTIIPGADREMWLGCDNEISLFRNNELVRTYDLKPYINRPYAQVQSIVPENGQQLLIGLDTDVLLRLDPRSGHIRPIADAVAVRTAVCVGGDSTILGSHTGLYMLHADRITRLTTITDKINNASVTGLVIDPNHRLWIATFGAGVYVVDRNGTMLSHFENAFGFCHNVVNSMFIDSQARIWAATQDGLACFDDPTLQTYKTFRYEQGLDNTNIHSVAEDLKGRIWFTTDRGISTLDTSLLSVRNYNFRDGVPSGSFSDTESAVGDDGTVYFANFNGLCYFDPKQLDTAEKISHVNILGYTVLPEHIEDDETPEFHPLTDKRIVLPYDENSFTLYFALPDFAQNSTVEYAYKLDGFDDRWINVGDNNSATFRSIPKGRYRFMVKARLHHQDWDEENAVSVRIDIRPPVWLRWYAILIYVLLAAAAIFFIIYSYKRHLQNRSRIELDRKKTANDQELVNERLRFYTNITHELRTPLTLILGPLEDLVQDKKLPAQYKGRIKIIHDSAMRLLNLINEILEFRKTETQNRKLTVARGSLQQLVKEIALRYKELNQNPNVSYMIDVPSNVGTDIYFDRDIVTTILNNLLSNAVKYTPSGHISISLRNTDEGGIHYTEIVVTDTGYGIDAEALPNIFDRYYQAGGKHQASGTGIGLALSKSLADLHGGYLTAQSIPGEGSTFVFRILTDNTYPDALHNEATDQPTPDSSDKAADEHDTPEEETDKRPLVLVVEDNDDIRRYIEDSFADYYRTAGARNGREGLAAARSLIPDIIISDIMMPEMDGLEMCRLIKDDILTSHIPIILLTAKDSIRDREEGYTTGADSYLTKPFSAKLLHSRVENLLESHSRLASSVSGGVTAPTSATADASGAATPPATRQGELRLSRIDREFVERLTGVIENHINNPDLDVAFLTGQMNMSNSTLYRKIKAVTGMSANELIRKIRLRHSVQLMKDDGMNISDAAYASGFNSVDYFRACFKEEYGTTPSDYIKKHR